MRYALVLVGLIVLLAPGAARADGDPASDVLYLQDVFLSYSRPPAAAATDLADAVAASNEAGYRVKVAVIATPDDLGLVSSLFGRPQVYADFLGAEIRSFFTAHLLVAMPQGFGIWVNRLDVATQQALLTRVKIEAGDSEGLTRAAAAAVRLLAAEDKSRPKVKDIISPDVRALAAQVKRGGVAHLRYVVHDDSRRSREEVRIYGPKLALLAVLRDPMGRATGQVEEVRWKTLKFLRPQHFRFCVVAIDPSGNQSRGSCAALNIT